MLIAERILKAHQDGQEAGLNPSKAHGVAGTRSTGRIDRTRWRQEVSMRSRRCFSHWS